MTSAVPYQIQVRSKRTESPALNVEEYLRLQEKLPEVTFRPLSAGLQDIRAVKNEEEIQRIRKAARIAGAIYTKYTHLEVESIYGGQPYYSYILSVE